MTTSSAGILEPVALEDAPSGAAHAQGPLPGPDSGDFGQPLDGLMRELEAARHLQRGLFPRRSLVSCGLEFAGECRAAGYLGGDYYGFRALPKGDVAVTVFDVAGHGITAALGMTLVRSALDGALARGSAPASVLGAANGLACEDMAGSGLFVTAFLATFDGLGGYVDHANAGHPRPVHWSASRRGFVEVAGAGVPLGIVPAATFPPGRAAFSPGDVMVIYTDGIVEATGPDGEAFGRHRLMGSIQRFRGRRADDVLRGLWRDLQSFTRGGRMRDDATLVVVRATPSFPDGGKR